MNKVTPTYRTIIVLVIMLLYVLALTAQNPIGNEEPEVKVIATATKNSVLLRWGVNTPTAWKYANAYGFTIERKTITRGGQILASPEIKMLTATPLQPRPMMEWEVFTETNDNAAIAAQAIYGESFSVDLENGGNAMVSIVNQATALEQRFSFALFAADQDFEVAKFSGLGYVDASVLPGEQYLYTIKTSIPLEKLNVKPGGAYIGLQDHQPLPEPLDFSGVFGDKNVMLSWNYMLQKRHYNNYIVERSEDKGNTFEPLDDIPVANLSERSKNPSDRMFYVDSLPQNNKEYQYRIKGISPFGEVGPASTIIKGNGTKALMYNPAIIDATLSKDEQYATITWEFPEEGMETVSHFEVNQSDVVKGGYRVLIPSIAKSQRTVQITALNSINYFTITAVGLNGSKRVSFPKMLQLQDSTPPAVPVEIKGSVDSTGVVQLRWKMNTENDFLGYRVFRANLANEEFTQITFEPIAVNKYTDTVNVKMLNSTIYYKIQAFDNRYNPSDFSEVLGLKKPDLIPPTQPVFKSFTNENGGITLDWTPSSSEDAAKTLLYRKEKGKNTSWVLVGDISIPESTFIDTTIQSGITYLYTMLTMDASGLESKPITPLTITAAKRKTPEIDRLNAYVNAEERSIRVSWKYVEPAAVEFSLFKAAEGEKLTLYKVLDADVGEYLDTKLKVNTQYTYGIQALLDNGSKSFIKKITVEY